MPAVTDDEKYCQWIARRAVARAALHLGIEHMTEEALTVLSSCLLEHLERVGATTAVTAEASVRTSEHCNVLDVLNAVEMCTSSAAAGVSTGNTNDPEASKTPAYPVESYKSLAVFCFGPDWNKEDAESRERQSMDGRLADSKGVGQAAGRPGWNVPFPEEIPAFPVRAKPVRPTEQALHQSVLKPIVPKSVKEAVDKMDVDKDSKPAAVTKTAAEDDDVHDAFWGSITRKREEESKDEESPPAKKQKLGVEEGSLFLPSFYPPVPRNILHAKSFSKVLAPTSEAPASDTPSVRDALAVPVGRRAVDNAKPTAVVPVSRASGSRVSRILEGSMDPAAS